MKGTVSKMNLICSWELVIIKLEKVLIGLHVYFLTYNNVPKRQLFDSLFIEPSPTGYREESLAPDD